MGKNRREIKQTSEEKREIKSQAKDTSLETKLAEIRSLQANIYRQVRHINRPAAALITVVVIPAVVNVLFLKKWSPFYNVYEVNYNSLTVRYDQLALKEVDKKLIQTYVSPQQEKWENAMKAMEDAILDLREEYGFSSELSVTDVLEKLDSDPVYKNVASFFKERFIGAFNKNLLNFVHGNEKIKVFGAFSKNPVEYSSKYLFGFVERSGKQYFERIKKYLNNHLGPAVKEVARMVIDKYIVQYKVMIAACMDYLLIEPLINKIFPHGIFQNPGPKMDILPTTDEEANKLIVLLENQYTALEKVARRNAKYARIASVGILGGAFLDLSWLVDVLTFNGLLSPEFVIILCVCLIATGSVNLLSDLYGIYESYIFEAAFKRQRETLEKILGKSNYKLTSINGGNLESSGFVLKFNKQLSGELSSEKLARIFKNILACNGVKTSIRRGNALIIPADCKLSSDIQKLFAKGIEKEKNIVKLKKEVRELLNICGVTDDYLPMYNMDSKGLPSITIAFYLPAAKISSQQLEGIFSDNALKIETKDGLLYVVMEGTSCVDGDKFEKFCSQIKSAIENQPSVKEVVQPDEKSEKNVSSSVVNGKSNVDKTKKEESKKDSPQERKSFIKPMPSYPHRRIQWGNVVYDSESKENTVYPLNIGQVHSFGNTMKARHFIKNDLDKEHVPSLIWDAIEEKVKDPQLVAGKGKQGFIFCRLQENDQKGDAFTTSMKLKLLGVFGKGNTRVYAKPEISSSGDMLHRLVSFDTRAHSNRR